MVELNISITGKVPRKVAEWIVELLLFLSEHLEINVAGGFAEVQDVQTETG